MNWTTFYVATAAGSATLLGLLFVAIQINIDTLAKDPQNRWRALALSTFNNFAGIFIFSLLMLFPNTNVLVSSLIVLIVAGFALVRLLLNWLPIWRKAFQTRAERLVEMALWLISPTAIYLAMIYLAEKILHGGPVDVLQQYLGYCIVGLLSITLRNSWKLLIDVAR